MPLNKNNARVFPVWKINTDHPPWNPPTSQHYRIEEFKEGPELVPHYADRR